MNSLERVLAAVEFQKTDRVPVIAQVFAHAASLEGVPVDDYVQDGETLARCQLKALERYSYDAVFTVMDVSVEAEAVGSILQYRRNQYPFVERYAFPSQEAWMLPELPDPEKSGRMPEMLKAIRLLREELDGEVLVVGCIMGPFTLTTQLLGLETALYMAVDDFARLEKIMDFATEVVIRFGQAQVRSGAHLPVVFDPSASPAVIPPKFFREFELPRLERIFRALTEFGAATNWLHIAGPTKPILPYYAQAGVGVANFDYCVDPVDAQGQLPATCLDGNIRPMAFMECGAAEIAADAERLLRAFEARRGFILSSGCEIPAESPPENVSAMVDAVRTRG